METLKSFHGDHEVKEFYLARVRHHREADELIQRTGWENGHGCAIGCTLEEFNHKNYPEKIGLPVWLAYTKDAVFEGIPKKEAMKFPEQFLSACQVGIDYTLMRHDWVVFLLTEIIPESERKKKYIINIIDLHKKAISGEEIPEKMLDDKGAAAEAAIAKDIAWSAAWSVVWSAAEAADNAVSSAWFATKATAWDAAEAVAYLKMRDRLLEMLKNWEAVKALPEKV